MSCKSMLTKVEKEFKRAFDAIPKNSNYAFVYQVRRLMNLPRVAFNALFDLMRIEGTIAAHPGNPGDLSDDEIRDSVESRSGEILVTVSWRGEPI